MKNFVRTFKTRMYTNYGLASGELLNLALSKYFLFIFKNRLIN